VTPRGSQALVVGQRDDVAGVHERRRQDQSHRVGVMGARALVRDAHRPGGDRDQRAALGRRGRGRHDDEAGHHDRIALQRLGQIHHPPSRPALDRDVDGRVVPQQVARLPRGRDRAAGRNRRRRTAPVRAGAGTRPPHSRRSRRPRSGRAARPRHRSTQPGRRPAPRPPTGGSCARPPGIPSWRATSRAARGLSATDHVGVLDHQQSARARTADTRPNGAHHRGAGRDLPSAIPPGPGGRQVRTRGPGTGPRCPPSPWTRAARCGSAPRARRAPRSPRPGRSGEPPGPQRPTSTGCT
jgi:hypothetical protein